MEREEKRTLTKIDLIVAPGKKVCITVNEGQDPREVANNFSRIYSLNDKNAFMLESVLEKHSKEQLSEDLSVKEDISVLSS